MTETTKKRVKAAGIAAAVLTILLLIALMFAVLGVGGFFGKNITRTDNLTYAQLSELDLSVPLLHEPSNHCVFTAYPERACLNTSFENGKVACSAYESQNAAMYFAVAKEATNLSFNIFATEGEIAGVSQTLGNIYTAQISGGGATLYYADKNGVRYALIPFGISGEEGVSMFNALFTFEN